MLNYSVAELRVKTETLWDVFCDKSNDNFHRAQFFNGQSVATGSYLTSVYTRHRHRSVFWFAARVHFVNLVLHLAHRDNQRPK